MKEGENVREIIYTDRDGNPCTSTKTSDGILALAGKFSSVCEQAVKDMDDPGKISGAYFKGFGT